MTDAILSVEGEGPRNATWVIIEDMPEGQWRVGDTLMGPDAPRRMSGNH